MGQFLKTRTHMTAQVWAAPIQPGGSPALPPGPGRQSSQEEPSFLQHWGGQSPEELHLVTK